MQIEVGTILIMAAAVTGFVKPLVDILKKSPLPTPSWSLPVLAILVGVIICFCLSVALGHEITRQIIGLDIVAGFSGGLGAIAVTELQRRSDKA